jgi:RimJ/RimL family protein N-acetyltransferase
MKESAMPVNVTARLRLRRFTPGDAVFALEMLNDDDFLRHIGDRGVRTLEDAERYLDDGPIASYEENGHGLYAVCLRDEPDAVIGMCGLLTRDHLPAPDLGFALMPYARRRGYTLEAARAVLEYDPPRLGLREVLAITSPENEASIRLLCRLGFEFDGVTTGPSGTGQVNMYRLAMT